MGPHELPLFEAGMASPNAPMEPSLKPFPLIVLSHGTGGTAMQMAWLGTALARAGFIAAAVDHPGNNGEESYTAEGFALWWERVTDLSEVIDGMLADENFGSKIDRDRIGAAGFSIGGYTVLELAGAQTDVSVLYDRCLKQPDQILCHVPEMKSVGTWQQTLAQTRKTSGASLAASADSYKDARVHAVFAIAPAVGFTLTQESLRAIRVPVEIAVGGADPIAPPNENADYIRSNIRGARETVLPGGVAHYTFLDTCTAEAKTRLGVYCADAPGVDRDKVHQQVAGEAAEFFRRALQVK
jgi:predicted dienelactone hydrolase